MSQVRQREVTDMSETIENCTKRLSEPCKQHPVDCPNCENGRTCGQRMDMRAHPDKIKSCPHFRPKVRSQL